MINSLNYGIFIKLNRIAGYYVILYITYNYKINANIYKDKLVDNLCIRDGMRLFSSGMNPGLHVLCQEADHQIMKSVIGER